MLSVSENLKKGTKERPRVVARLSTTSWRDSRGLHFKRSLTPLHRKCRGYNFLEEDASDLGAKDVLDRIQNLNSVQDGVYELLITDIQIDREFGSVLDYGYYLSPFTE